jgi:nucleoside-diphosphate-sugar epimerase
LISSQKTALIIGSTGIAGSNLARQLVAGDWNVYGLARNPELGTNVHPLSADLLDQAAVKQALDGLDITDVFICAWLRQPTEHENVRVNGEMVENLFTAIEGAKHLSHAALVTGTKHYLGPFESYGKTMAETPFREDQPRLPGENFYYTQEDILFAAAKRLGFTWSVHRAHTVIGYALGNAMNMGVTLAVYATICRETGRPFVFPGSREQWNFLTDICDARLLAKQLEWAAATPAAHNQAFNTVNGDIFRWRCLWPQIAAYFGVEAAPPPEPSSPLESQMRDSAVLWKEIAAKYDLVESRVEKLASWWHTDADLGRQIECVNDMSKSRRLGFMEYNETPASFFELFDQLKAARVIP